MKSGSTSSIAKEKEKTQVQNVLIDNGYKPWMFKAPQKPKPRDKNSDRTSKSRSYPIPYIQGISEHLARVYKKYGVATHFKPYNTVRNMLVKPKDKTPDDKKCGVIYQLECESCGEIYIGETARAFGIRLKEHCKQKGSLTAMGDHFKATGHKLAKDKHRILTREDNYWPRKICEAIEIKLKKPGLNRDAGYHLSPVYNTLLGGDLIPRSPVREAECSDH